MWGTWQLGALRFCRLRNFLCLNRLHNYSVLLLQRSDTDTYLKDFEGYTAFDLYNSTVEGTKPNLKDALDLFTWGANRCVNNALSS